MKVISFLTSKGGGGKSTLAINTARKLQAMGYDVGLLDTDEQASIGDWEFFSKTNTIPVHYELSPAKLHSTVKKLKHDILILDGDGSLNGMIFKAFSISDLIVIPIKASPLDVWASRHIMKVVKAHEDAGGKAVSRIILNEYKSRNLITAEVDDAIQGYPVKCFKTRIRPATAWVKSFATGSTVVDIQKRGNAIDDLTNMTNEILELI